MAVDDGPRGAAGGAGQRPPLQLSGVDGDLLRDLEQPVTELEVLHEPEALSVVAEPVSGPVAGSGARCGGGAGTPPAR